MAHVVRVRKLHLKASDFASGSIVLADDGQEYVCEDDIWELFCEWRSEDPENVIVLDAPDEITKSKTQKTRELSAYNKFLKQTLQKLKDVHPHWTNKERMAEVSKMWQKEKGVTKEK